MNTTELATALGVTKGRVSQYVAQGKLDGCFTGEGRSRRFDLGRVKVALGRALDPAQMLGNGRATKAALALIAEDGDAAPAPPAKPRGLRDGAADRNDADSYEMARTAAMLEELRSRRLRNARDEGLFVLAAEVERNVARIIAQEMAEMETVIRDAARAVADQLGVDYRTARKVMLDVFRAHRARRSQYLAAQAEGCQPTEAEIEADA